MKKKRIFAAETTKSLGGLCLESICTVQDCKIRQNFPNGHDTDAFADMFWLSPQHSLKHRIKFLPVYFGKGVWRYLQSDGTGQQSSMLSCCETINADPGTQKAT